jgi:hypothetical protein
MADNVLEIVLRAAFGDFNKSIDQSKAKVEQFTTQGSAGLGKISTATNAAARAASSLGLRAEFAGARVGALAEAFDGLGASMGPLLALGAALVAIGEGIKFLWSGANAAKEMQSSLETMRAAVEGQGKAWDSVSGSIQSFLDIESKASGFTRNELASAMNELIAASISVSDAETVVAVADEIAIAKHRDLNSIVKLLLGTEGARAMGLVRMFPTLKTMILNHAKLGDVLAEVHKITVKQIEADDSLARAQARQKAASEAAGEAIGKVLLPFLTQWNYEVIGAIENAKQFGHGFMEMAGAIGAAIAALASPLVHFFGMIDAGMHGKLGQAKAEFGALTHGISDIPSALGKLGPAIADAWKNMTWGIPEAGDRGRAIGEAAVKAHNKAIEDGLRHLDFNPRVGIVPKHSGKDTSEKEERSRIDTLKSLMAQRLQVYKDAIEKQKTYLDDLEGQKADIHIGAQGPTAAQTAALDAITAKTIQHQEVIRQLNRDMAADERQGLRALEQERDRIARNPKLANQYRELITLIDEYKTKIGELAKAQSDAQRAESKAWEEKRKRDEEDKKRNEEKLKQLREIFAAQVDLALTQARSGREVTAAGRTTTTPLQAASERVSQASENSVKAQKELAAAQAAAALAKGAADELESKKRLIEAEKNLVAADAQLQIAQIEEAKVVEALQPTFKNLSQAFLKGVPELQQMITAFQSAGSAASGWGAVLMILIQNSQTFKDLMQMASSFLKLFGEILDQILRPVLLIVAKVLTLVANGVIVLYNAFATLVSVLGIHIDKLKYINSLLDDTGSGIKPLLDIVHDLPSLKEYGAGQWGALQPDQFSGVGGTVAAIQAQTTAQTSWFTKLISLGVALLAIDWLTHGKFFADMGQFINNFIQGIGGLSNFIEMAGGIALITANTKGIFGIITKVLGVLLIIQSLFGILGGGGGILGSILGGSGGGSTGLLGGAGGLLGAGIPGTATVGMPGGASIGSAISAGLGTPVGATTIGTAGLVGIGGALVGSFLANFTGAANKAGGKQDASALAGAGAAVGLIFGGPVGAAIGTVAGTLIGGLFGNPNKGDAPMYGQTAADLSGSNNANNAGYVEDPQLKAALGGDTLIQAVEKTLAQYGTSSNAPAWLQPIFSQLSAMFGISSTGSGSIQYGKNEMLGVGGAAGAQGGTPFTYQQYDDIITQFLTGLSGAATSAGTATGAGSSGTGGTGSTAVSTNVGGGMSTAPTESDLINAVLQAIGVDPTAAGDPTLGAPPLSGGTGSTTRSLLDATSGSGSDPLTLAITALTSVMTNIYNYFTGTVAGIASGISGGAPAANVALSPFAGALTGAVSSKGAPSVTNISQSNTFGDVSGIDNVDALGASLGKQIEILARTDAFTTNR